MRYKSIWITISVVYLMFSGISVVAQSSSQSITFRGLLSVGMHSMPGDPNISPYLALSLGVDIKDKAYLSAGAGVLPCFIPNKYDGWNLGAVLPAFYLQSDIYVTQLRSWRPYVSVSAGFSFERNIMHVTYAKLGVGIEFKGLAMQVGYTPMIVKYAAALPLPDRVLFHGLYFDVGYRFKAIKYNMEHTLNQTHTSDTSSSNQAIEQSSNQMGKRAHFQGVGCVGVSVIPYAMPSTTLLLGVIKDDRYFFGGGIGVLVYMSKYHNADPMNKSLYAVPTLALYLQSDIYLTRKWCCSPYITLAAGTALPFIGYVKAGLGLDYRSFVWQLSYSPFFPFDDASLVSHGVSLNFGYRFNTAKYNHKLKQELILKK